MKLPKKGATASIRPGALMASRDCDAAAGERGEV